MLAQYLDSVGDNGSGLFFKGGTFGEKEVKEKEKVLKGW